MTVKELLKRRAALLETNRALLATVAAENRDMTDDEDTQAQARLAEVEKLDSRIAILHRQDELTAAGAVMAEPASEPVATASAPNAASAPFAHLGDFLAAVAHSSQPGETVDPRLYRFAAPTGANEAIPSQGGFLVQQDLIGGLLTPTYEASVLASRCRRFPVGPNSNGIKINSINETSRADGSRWGGVRGYWLAEAGTKTGSKPEFKQIELSLKKVAGLFYATDELLQDATALNAVVSEAFPTELAWQLDDKVMNGTGAGVPQGIAVSGARVTVAKETGQAAATLQYENLNKMYSRMPGRLRAGAVWFYNQEIEPQLFTLGMTLGTGGAPVWLPPGGISGTPYASLFGRPMVPCEHCAALGTEGDIVFANMGEYALIEKGGVQVASSIHVLFTTDESVFRFVYRVDGRPLWTAALTPYKGSATQSPFVTLATRA